MSSLALLIMYKIMKTINPTKYAFLILSASLLSALLLFKVSLTSWSSLVLVMIFSSGMMTLFIYVTSLVPAEKSNDKSSLLILFLPILCLSLNPTKTSLKQGKFSMKTFSQQTLLILMMTILIITMLAISVQSFNPQQSMSSTF